MEENKQNQPASSPPPGPTEEEADSLDAQTTIVEDSQATDATSGTTAAPTATAVKEKKKNKGRKFIERFNIYLLLFIFLLVVAGVVTAVSVIKSRQVNNDGQSQIKTEPLSQEALDQLRQTDVKVGDPKQILSVESNAIFAGRVLVRGSLEVAGEIKSGAPLNIPGLTVSGNSTLSQVQANELQVAGSATIQGAVNIQNNLSVSGSGTFGGTLTAGALNVQNLQINGDVQFTRHIDAGGGTPGKSDGSALGSGGTSSLSGTDSAGTVTINTGGGTGPGCFISINFAQRFNGTAHVVVTPVGSAAGGLNYYINRSNSSFSICTLNAAPPNQSFAFDYIAID